MSRESRSDKRDWSRVHVGVLDNSSHTLPIPRAVNFICFCDKARVQSVARAAETTVRGWITVRQTAFCRSGIQCNQFGKKHIKDISVTEVIQVIGACVERLRARGCFNVWAAFIGIAPHICAQRRREEGKKTQLSIGNGMFLLFRFRRKYAFLHGVRNFTLSLWALPRFECGDAAAYLEFTVIWAKKKKQNKPKTLIFNSKCDAFNFSSTSKRTYIYRHFCRL